MIGRQERRLVERAGALHFPSQQQVGLVRVDNAARRLVKFHAEVYQVETIEFTKAELVNTKSNAVSVSCRRAASKLMW